MSLIQYYAKLLKKRIAIITQLLVNATFLEKLKANMFNLLLSKILSKLNEGKYLLYKLKELI